MNIRLDINELYNKINEDKAKLKNKYDVLYKSSLIEFYCNCGNEFKKIFKNIKIAGAFCKKCTREKVIIKLKEICLQKYGVENISQSKEIKDKKKQTCLKNHGVEYSLQSQKIRQKAKDTIKQKYGVDNIMDSNLIKNKLKKSILKKYGVENPSQSEEIKKKKKETSLKNYGVEYPSQTNEIKEKIISTNLSKYGCKYTLQNKNIKEKGKITNLEKYGCEYPAQNKELQEKIEKSSKKYKDYKMPSGEIRRVQGFEPFALDDLLKIYNEDEIITRKKYIPRIEYILENKKHYYFPDIFIKKENKIIEVKSVWTSKLNEHIVLEKENASKKLGYLYEIWIYNRKGKRLN